MSSTIYYKQSVFDHASLPIAVTLNGDEDPKSNYDLLNHIRINFDFINIRISDKLKKIFFNYKQDFSSKEREWENFQAHHRPFGLLFIGEFRYGFDFKKILDNYIAEKERLDASIYESRLVLIYNDNSRSFCNFIKRTLNINGDISLSSVDSETGEMVMGDALGTDYTEELKYIQDYFIQNELIWQCRSAINVSRLNSTNSLNDSSCSSVSNNWKKNSFSSENPNQLSLSIDNSLKSFETASFEEKSFDSEIRNFLKLIFEKVLNSLNCREVILNSKSEQTRSKQLNSETISDSGSVVSLDDGEFNLTDPLDLDLKKFQEESRFNKNNKSRLYLGRLNKQTADHSLLCGNYSDAFYFYQVAICYFRKVNDQLWLAGAEEGLCCSWILYCFRNHTQALDPQLVISLHDKSRQLFLGQPKTDHQSFLSVNNNMNSPSDQTDFSFLKKFSSNDLFKNPPEIQNLTELSEKYHSCISRYKKILINKTQTLYPINFDSIIKASRFFVDQHRFLDAANFLKMIKSDLLKTQNDKEQYHNTLARLYSQMGFFRKSALHKYNKSLLMHNKLSAAKNLDRKSIYEQKLSVLIDILSDLNVKCSDLFHEKAGSNLLNLVNDGLNEDGFNQGFQSLKMQIIIELYSACKMLNYSTNVLLGLGLSILDNWYHLIARDEYERMIRELNSFSKLIATRDNQVVLNACVMNLPRLKQVILRKLPDYLIPKQPLKPCNEKSVFIFTPIKINSNFIRGQLPEPVIWICGEECEIVLIFDNLINLPLQLLNVLFLLTNTATGSQIWVPSEGSSIHYLPACDRNINCHFVIVPNPQRISLGNYNITNISYSITSIINITFQPHKLVTDLVFQSTVIPEIKLYSMMPQLRIMSSISETTKNSSFSVCKFPPNTVFCCNIDLYLNEILEFSLFLSNESKELDIDQIVCLLDELELNVSSKTLISRFADQEFSNRKISTHKLLSFPSNCLEKFLPIKSISSLKDSVNLNPDNPNLPTDAIVKFRIDTTNEEFNQELLERFSMSDSENSEVLWSGQLKLTVRYWSNYVSLCDSNDNISVNSDVDDIVVVQNESKTLSNAYRESVCLFNCQIMAGLSLINYYLDEKLNLVLSLMNFTRNKMNVEIFWNDVKIQKSYIVASSNDYNSDFIDSKQKNRNSSTELFSHISNLIVPFDHLKLKSTMNDGFIKSEEDLTCYIQKNLKISWILKDKILDKFRQGFVNLTWCNCYVSQFAFQNVSGKEMGHRVLFSTTDLIKIWMHENVKLEMRFTNNESTSPVLPDETGIAMHLYDGLEYDILCTFKDQWPSFICESHLTSISLLPCASSNKISTPSLSSSESDNGKLQCFLFAGNNIVYLQKNSIPLTSMRGFIMFLLPGSYCVSCRLVISDSMDCHKVHTDLLVLLESEKHQINII